MMPDKIYVRKEEMGDVWTLDATTRDNGGERYIRKEALLEWAKEQKKWRIECDYEGTRYVSAIHALNHLIDKLNSM